MFKHTSKCTLAIFVMVESDFAQQAKPDCQCRSPDGSMQNMGAVACFEIVGAKSLARCEMSTKTPYWKKIDGVTGCPSV
ncbi:MAG: hypothetical protein ACI9UN_003785 [Granulosicoccus sp.]|jgi:hypothetical protein